MRLRWLFLPLSFVFISFSIMFGITGLWSDQTVYAAGTKTLTVSETRALIGDTIHAKYFNGSDYVDFDFVYNSSTWTVSQVQCESSDALPTVGDTLLLYDHSGSFNVNTNRSYIQVDLYPEYSFFDTTLISQYVGVSSGSTVSSSVYSPPAWRWYTSFSGDKFLYNDWMSSANSGFYSFFTMGFDSSMPFDFVQINESSQSTFSAYSYRVLFYGNSSKNGHLYLAISCPTISDDSTMQSGTAAITTGSGAGGGDVNVTVTVDMEETNSILTTISGLLSGLVDGIKNLFIPTQQDITDFKTGLDTLLSDIFGPLWTAQSLLRTALLELGEIQLADSVLFPGVTIDVSGNQTFTLASQSVPLNPDSTNTTWSSFLEAVRLAIDIVCTVMVINMLKDKLEYIINHPRSKP